MTGKELFKIAVNLLGYGDSDRARQTALDALNGVYAEIFYTENGRNAKFTPLDSMNDELNLSQFAKTNCAVYGLCAALALSENDADSQGYYASIYNARLSRLPLKSQTRANAVSFPEGGSI